LVQVGWVLTEVDGAIVDSQVRLIRPEGFQISPGSFNKHGISTAYATEHGVGIADVPTKFAEAAQGATNAIAHNIDFDSKVMGAAFNRIRMANPLRGKQLRCTMTEATNYCRIPSGNGRGFKWPSLEELHQKLFQSPVDGAHDAKNDCLACMRCYFRLRELGVMS
jgi:DNA polymerase III epsilon subunit-like protein